MDPEKRIELQDLEKSKWVTDNDQENVDIRNVDS